MASEVIMPQMGESIAEGTITKWLKKVGDVVEHDEPLFEISTDKVDAEIPAPQAGTLLEILVGEGETVEINTVVARIGEEDGAGAKSESKEPEPSPTPANEKSQESEASKSEGPEVSAATKESSTAEATPSVPARSEESKVPARPATRGRRLGRSGSGPRVRRWSARSRPSTRSTSQRSKAVESRAG